MVQYIKMHKAQYSPHRHSPVCSTGTGACPSRKTNLINSFYWLPPTNIAWEFYYFLHEIIESAPESRALPFWPGATEYRILYLSLYVSDSWKFSTDQFLSPRVEILASPPLSGCTGAGATGHVIITSWSLALSHRISAATWVWGHATPTLGQLPASKPGLWTS